METIINNILTSPKYSGVCEDTVRRVTADAFARYRKPKDAEKSVRETLHGITGAFMSPSEMRRAAEYLYSGDIQSALKLHSSTRERAPLDEFYTELFEKCEKPKRLLDIACGMNPVYLGSCSIETVGIDINRALMELIDGWADKTGIPVKTYARDILCEGAIPDGEFDMTLLMKLLPVLETQKKGSAAELLRKAPSQIIVATFPTRTLSGRKIGMEKHYSEWFESIVPEGLTIAHRYVRSNELIYVVCRNGTEPEE